MGSVNEKCPHGVTKRAYEQFSHACYRCAPAGTPDFTSLRTQQLEPQRVTTDNPKGLTTSQLDSHSGVTRDTEMTKPELGISESFRPGPVRFVSAQEVEQSMLRAGAPFVDPEIDAIAACVNALKNLDDAQRFRAVLYLKDRFQNAGLAI